MNLKHLLFAGGALLGTTAAQAGGFQLTLAGQKNNGMGGVGTGLALDQAAMFYNPGALAMVRERGVQIGVNATLARQAFRAQYGGAERQLDNTVSTPFNFYAGFGPAEGKWKAGIGVYTPFGSRLDYADNWEGRTALTSIDLKSIFVQPTVSYAVTDQLSIGAGLVVFASGSVNLQRDIQDPAQGSIELDGSSDTKLGWNAGVFFKPSDKFSLGISHRSKMDAVVTGGDVIINGVVSSLADRFAARKFDVTLPLPATTTIGFGVMPTEKLTLGFDVNYATWSRYQELVFNFDAPINGQTVSRSRREYQDALTFRLGGQYQVTDGLTVRLGGAYDQTPVKDGFVTPETPDNDRLTATAGVSYKFGERFGIDVSAQYVNIAKRSQTQEDLLNNGVANDRVAGTYKTIAVVPGFGLNYNF
ncbi:OmpP1/FadL family transporter [Solirubrum puertoriconensis]|uniref:Long-chain fatty acid transporter permease n=1 Tax=Solirubrum puertoriconensis TaxID=1751427 RepID=A0A9X0HHV2_SOLP1|nr:outer membrane protein transport protein [Solirubrum puertoriconensis]KUG06162.1 hypothetical protein ASU33_01995 [Solirubrum puertoriconensis]